MGFIGVQPTSAPLTASDITDGIVSNAKLSADSVNAAKISDDSISEEHIDITAITGHSAITSLADTDKFLVSDASDSGNLKYVEKQYLGGGGLQFISKLESTSDTDTLVFNGIMDNTSYSAYKVIATLRSGGNGAEINFRFRRNSGSQSGNDYRYANFMYSGELGTANVGGTDVNLANLVTDASTTVSSIEMNLIPSGTLVNGNVSIGHWKGMIDKYNSNTRKARTIMGAFYYNNGDVPDGFQIVNQTANFEDYEIFVYGIVKA